MDSSLGNFVNRTWADRPRSVPDPGHCSLGKMALGRVRLLGTTGGLVLTLIHRPAPTGLSGVKCFLWFLEFLRDHLQWEPFRCHRKNPVLQLYCLISEQELFVRGFW